MLPAPARAFTYHDLADLPADGYKREIIGGALIVTPAPNWRHQRVSANLTHLLLQAETPKTMVLASPLDWFHDDGGVVQPDLVVLRRSQIEGQRRLEQPTTPLLVVEILSPSNRAYDLTLKRDLYQRLGVPAYWIVDPVGPSVVVLRLDDGRYRTEAEVGAGEELVTDRPFPIRLRPDALVR